MWMRTCSGQSVIRKVASQFDLLSYDDLKASLEFSIVQHLFRYNLLFTCRFGDKNI